MLSSLSQFVGVVMAPRRTSVFRHIEFLRLSEKRFLVIIVSPDGDVQNRVIFTEADYTQSQLVEAANYLNSHYAGMAIEEVRERLKNEVEALRGEIATLMQAAVKVSSEAIESGAGRGGDLRRAQPAGRQRFFRRHGQPAQAVRPVRAKGAADAPARRLQPAEGVRIYIGGESQVIPYQELSVVSAPYEVDGQVVGTLGVIGPMRMPYEKMIQIVDITSKLVSNALSHSK
jgi:heat-inducible transcriptional repressor